MLGHQVCRRLAERFDTWASYRHDPRPWHLFGRVAPAHALGDIEASAFHSIETAIERVQPDAVVNCIGIVKQREQAHDAVASITVNSLLPHRLSGRCRELGARLIHISSDCVFSGRTGAYTEQDVPDPIDLYGRSKLLGEVDSPGCLTIRTSVVGWELSGSLGLLEWFALQRGQIVRGYSRAIYSGLCSAFLADLIGFVLEEHPHLHGLYQVATEPIDKMSLLLGLRDALGWQDIVIEQDEEFRSDRSLIGTRFTNETGWKAPSWSQMIAQLALERPEYEMWRASIGSDK